MFWFSEHDSFVHRSHSERISVSIDGKRRGDHAAIVTREKSGRYHCRMEINLRNERTDNSLGAAVPPSNSKTSAGCWTLKLFRRIDRFTECFLQGVPAKWEHLNIFAHVNCKKIMQKYTVPIKFASNISHKKF